MPEVPFVQIDAFASAAFRGNQACVMPFDAYPDDETLQAIAAENNVAETAFIIPNEDRSWRLRWFTPTTEVPLCGHATLAAAHWLFTAGGFEGEEITFHTVQSGALHVRRVSSGLEMDFPAQGATPIEIDAELVTKLGAAPVELHQGLYLAARFETAEEIRALAPDLSALPNIGCYAFDGDGKGDGVAVTSRFFAPLSGIPEDPATGSWHCILAVLAAERVSGPVKCFQAYPGRGAEIEIELIGDRVKLRGQAQTVIEGLFRF